MGTPPFFNTLFSEIFQIRQGSRTVLVAGSTPTAGPERKPAAVPVPATRCRLLVDGHVPLVPLGARARILGAGRRRQAGPGALFGTGTGSVAGMFGYTIA